MTFIELLDRRLDEYRAQLARLDALRDGELAKPPARQKGRLLRFVYRERCVYRFALAEMTALRAHVGGAGEVS